MKLDRLSKADGSWQKFEATWQSECAKYGEDFDSYAEASLRTLRDECDDAEIDPNSGVFSLTDDEGRHHAACFLNNAQIKGYSGYVLRVRHLVLSPYYDFEDLEIEEYSSILGQYFVALINCSESTLISKHVKIHYRSPYDRTFFATFVTIMKATSHFQTVESKGMWLHLTK